MMEKYGVDTHDGNDKKAGAPGACPVCGGEVTRTGPVQRCERCGSAPFERRGGGDGGRAVPAPRDKPPGR